MSMKVILVTNGIVDIGEATPRTTAWGSAWEEVEMPNGHTRIVSDKQAFTDKEKAEKKLRKWYNKRVEVLQDQLKEAEQRLADGLAQIKEAEL